ncbi:MAG: hypothetical protein OES38_12695 [Gammaproteobacteria bacterium]|nr:hypothetical protein [Gammaproteobacteria bacterium]
MRPGPFAVHVAILMALLIKSAAADSGYSEFSVARLLDREFDMEAIDGSISSPWETRESRQSTRFSLLENTEIKVAHDRFSDAGDALANRFAIDVTHVRRLQNGMRWSMNGFVAQLKKESTRGKLDGTDAEITAGWFFHEDVGVGARVAVGEREGSGDFTRYEAFADYRLTTNASVGVRYMSEHIAEFDQTTNALLLGITYRR